MAHITLDDVGLQFRIYQKLPSLKEYLVGRLRRGRGYAEISRFWALRDVNIEFRAGERIGVIGDNGAGKSTLMKAIARIYRPTVGTIDREGFLIPLLEIGIGFNTELTAVENIFLCGAMHGFRRRDMEKKVTAIFDFSELHEFANTPLKYFSSGMAMRLAFTIATEVEPEILILDEVFSVGDIHWAEKARPRMQTLLDQSKIVILVSHSMDLIRKTATRVILLDHGRVLRDGPPEEVIGFYQGGGFRAAAGQDRDARPGPVRGAARP